MVYHHYSSIISHFQTYLGSSYSYPCPVLDCHFFLEQNNILLTITFGSLTQLWTMVNLWMTHLYLHIQNAVFFPQQTVTYIKTHESMIKSQTNQTEGLRRQLIQGMTFCLAEAVLVFQDHSTNQCMYYSQCITIDCSLCLIH